VFSIDLCVGGEEKQIDTDTLVLAGNQVQKTELRLEATKSKLQM